MRIYYEKQKFIVVFLKFLAFIAFLATIFFGIIFGLQHYRIVYDYLEYQDQIQLLIIGCGILFVVLYIIARVVKKRKNIRFDGRTIKFCINNYVESEFDLKKIDELFKYRSSPKIDYGYQDALAFRFHKNDIWENIDSSYTNLKTKEKSSVLISEINQAYAYIKSQRVIKQISPSQGVRFRYLTLEDSNANDEEYNNVLKELESSFHNYTNTYGNFNLDRLVVTNDSLYYNRDKIASIKNGCFVDIKKVNPENKKYLSSEKILFLNRRNELIISIDTTRVVNSELFKTLVLSIFPYKPIADQDIIIKQSSEAMIIEDENNETIADIENQIKDNVDDNVEPAVITDNIDSDTNLIVASDDKVKPDEIIEEDIVQTIEEIDDKDISKDEVIEDKKDLIMARQPRKRKRRKL